MMNNSGFSQLKHSFSFHANRLIIRRVLARQSDQIKRKLIVTHETAPLFLYNPIKLATYSLGFQPSFRKAGPRSRSRGSTSRSHISRPKVVGQGHRVKVKVV